MKTKLVCLILIAMTSTALSASAGPKGRMMERVVEKMDVNEDGVISIDEFEPRREGRIIMMDANGDNAVSTEELNSHIAERQAEIEERIAKMQEKVQAMFEAADANADGLVTLDEARIAKFNRIDTDGDGVLTLEEIQTARSERGKRRKERGRFGHDSRYAGD